MFWIWLLILLILLLVAGVVFAVFYIKQTRQEWELEMMYLTRHQGDVDNTVDSYPQNDVPTVPTFQNFREVYKTVAKRRRDKEALEEKQAKLKATKHDKKATMVPASDLSDLPIFSSLQEDPTVEKPTTAFEPDKKIVEQAAIKHKISQNLAQNLENEASLLSHPAADLEVITVDVDVHKKTARESGPQYSSLKIIELEDLNLPIKVKENLVEKKIIYIDKTPPRTSIDTVIKQQTATTTISGDEIKENLLRQRLARRQDDVVIAKNIVVPEVIQQQEVLNNLANTDSPINRLRHKVKRQVIRESIIPEAARINEAYSFAIENQASEEATTIHSRFTPYSRPDIEQQPSATIAANSVPLNLIKEAPVIEIHQNQVQLSKYDFDDLESAEQENLTLDEHHQPKDNFSVVNVNNPTYHIDNEEALYEDDFSVENKSTFHLNEEQDHYSEDKVVSIDFDADIDECFAVDEPFINKPIEESAIDNNVVEDLTQHTATAYINDQQTLHLLPDLSLLEKPEFNPDAQQTEEALIDNGIKIEEKLAEFKVKVNVVDAYSGPVITRYEIEPDIGVRGNQVLNLEKDLARALGCASIRIVETIPGKTCMGLELPNPKRQMIRLSEILASSVFTESKSKLTVALGHDITGAPVVTDLAKAPHLLVAGTTGSGKSVGVNAMIISMLFKATPDEVRLIMIDPKMLELSIYEGIPHLLAPVVTDMKLAANALSWCVNEMEKRYRLMSHVGVRNLAGYNARVQEGLNQGRRIANPFSLTPDDPEPLEKLPFIVVVVDEFADLMMTSGKKIEELIARLAQKARAAGIHLILATQRPSVDVITGLIKANIPTRIAFQVSSKVDSRTIIDQMGAESLLGQGDMLFLPPGTAYPQRIHGAFVADGEVHQVVEYLKQFGEVNYIDDILTAGVSEDDLFSNAAGQRNNDGENDPLYDEAVNIVLKTQKASISFIQRNLRIGYNRAARLVEQMEASGILSAPEHNGNRTILVPNRESE